MHQAASVGSQTWTFEGLPYDLLVAHVDDPLPALIEAVRRRRRGLEFAVFPVVHDPRAALARALGSRIATQFTDPDEMFAAFDGLAAGTLAFDGRPQHELAGQRPQDLETLGIVCRLATALIARSRAEAARFEQLFGRCCDNLIVSVPVASVPDFTVDAGANDVVVWAPHAARSELAAIIAALGELRFPVSVVCADPSTDGGRIAYAGVAEGATVLRRARLVLDADPSGPEAALALARGPALAVASTSGAQEYLDHAAAYDPWDRRSIVGAILTGMAQPPAERASPATIAVAAQLPSAPSYPLVSLIVRTRDRPDLLRRALASARAQRYPNVEIIVVNDGGADVGAIVAEVAGARLIAHDRARGANAAANTGLGAAAGRYIGLLDDDDLIFPDHLDTLVDALESSAAAVAHTQALTVFVQRAAAGSLAVSGFKLFIDQPVLPSELHHTCRIIPLVALLRRDALVAAGGFPEAIPLMGDWDTFLRLARASDIVTVPRITALYTVRADGGQMTADRSGRFVESFQAIHARNPAPGRPALQEMQAAVLAARLAQGGPVWPQPALRLSAPMALADL